MRICCFVIALFIATIATAQSQELKAAAAELDRALVAKDTQSLKRLLHNEITYGHSNGWVQTKQDVISDLVTGKLLYNKIESSAAEWTESEQWATMRNTTEVHFSLSGKEGYLRLHVLQVWVKTGDDWQLLARQSAKL